MVLTKRVVSFEPADTKILQELRGILDNMVGGHNYLTADDKRYTVEEVTEKIGQMQDWTKNLVANMKELDKLKERVNE